MAAGLKDFYRNVNGDAIADAPAASDAGGPKPESANPAQQSIDAGRQYDELLKSYKALNALLQEAQAGSGVALGRILENFGSLPAELEVTITEPLRNARGEEPENFGMKLIGSQQEWNAIARDYQTVLMYFPGIELKSVPTNQRGKRLAVVMGVTAREFNAVIAAERKRERLVADMKTIDSDREKARKDMGVDKMPRMPAGNDKLPVAKTPEQEKSSKGKIVEGV